MTSIIVGGLVSFVVTALAKTHTRLAGTPYLNLVNLSVSFVASLCAVWQGDGADGLTESASVIVSTLASWLVAYATNKLAKPSYR